MISITVARKPLTDMVAGNVQTHGTGGINIDASRIAGSKPLLQNTNNAKGLFGLGSRVTAGSSTEGRWPTNLVFEHLPSCVRRGTQTVRGVQRAAGNTGFGSEREDNYILGTGAQFKPDLTLDVWECPPGCPVADLGGQSGERKAGGSLAGGEPSKAIFGLRDHVAFTSHNDVGTASRFYAQFQGSKSQEVEP